MPTSRALLLVPVLLAGCSGAGSDGGNGASASAGADRIECARGGGAMQRQCWVERSATPAGLVLTLRHPDGAFHRVLVTGDGRGVVAADGAEAVTVGVAGAGAIDVAVGGDRYRLPATVRAGAGGVPAPKR